ncbi:Alpha-mannosidase 2 [Dermatophagoides pteronyssinus]|uniref:Alpha-mannosidase 2 n=1 Tax=Dermatophagoides pteronyssinus TaxID=6956 RepID=A0ABQ8JR07_DERPT|nr:Alpha-mannosidase 2 [Dermatophagoides pteronyssinus]
MIKDAEADVHVSLISQPYNHHHQPSSLSHRSISKWFYRRFRRFILLQSLSWSNFIIVCLIILFIIVFLFSEFNVLIQSSNTSLSSKTSDLSTTKNEYIRYIEELSSISEHPSHRIRAAQINEQLRRIEMSLKENREILHSIRNITSQAQFFPDIDMHQVYEQMPFDNVDGGVWKQGWPLEIEELDFQKPKPKLKVFIVPHSHNDPGWIKTFDVYFSKQTQHILTNAVEFMTQHPDMRFIWAETSYLSAWWETTNDAHREMLRRLIIEKRFEIVTGGWVMNDEANTHYWSILHQMIEGHEWLENNIDSEHQTWRPKHGWAIDPFGMSPTMAYLLKLMGFRAMVVQRVHYSIKKHLAHNHQLEFRWRQYWEQTSTTSNDEGDIVCHVEPFYSYDIPHTCGPDPKVCCQFDFKRLAKPKCPWKINPQIITDANVEERAKTLLDQYRKKSLLYRTNSLLVPLGDDFRYDDIKEWRNQYDNYRRIMHFLNSRSEFNVEIKFATLNDYFDSILTNDGQLSQTEQFPTLVGDFFTYADRDDHYWSGYYTSKPFYKRFERILASHSRAVEILFPWPTSFSITIQNLALFQHHDGITGTAKDSVVVDYANRMLRSFQILQKVATSSLSMITNHSIPELEFMHTFVNIQSPIRKHSFLLNPETRKYFILYNSLGWTLDTQVFCFDIHWTTDNFSMPDWCLTSNDVDSSNPDVSIKIIQINHQWRDLHPSSEPLEKRREICFQPKLGPISLRQYCFGHCRCSPVDSGSYRHHEKHESFVTLYNSHRDSMVAKKPFDYHVLSLISSAPNTTIENELIRLTFDSTSMNGLLKSWSYYNFQTKSWISIDVKMTILTFGTKSGGKNVQKSGAYIFLPDDQNPVPLEWTNKPKIRVTIGNLESRYEWMIEEPYPVHIRFSLYRGRPTVEMQTEFHLQGKQGANRELLIRFEIPQIDNGDRFYTDLNGLQMIARKRYAKIPLQGNVYPLTTIAWIEDNEHRFTAMSGQPLGVTSLRRSTMEIFLDRRLMQDDFRGLNQGVLDNRQTREIFRLMLEPTTIKTNSSPTLTSGMMFESQTLLNPIIGLTTKQIDDDRPPINKISSSKLKLLQSSLPCDLHLLNLRRSISRYRQFSLWLHRTALSCDSKCLQTSNSTYTVNLSKYLSEEIVERLEPKIELMNGMSWFHHSNQTVPLNQTISIGPMQLLSYRLYRITR